MRLFILMFGLFLFSCQQQARQKTNNLDAIKDILALERKAHLSKNASLLFSNDADTVLEINRGIVRKISPEQGRQRFQNYFNSVDFVKWDDVAEPIFHFSEDSTMAVVTIQKLVVIKEHGSVTNDTTNFAWTSVFCKNNGKWKLQVITSTNNSSSSEPHSFGN